MGESVLKNRTRFTSSLKNELIPLFDKLSEETKVTKTKLLDEAIKDLLKKHNQYTSECDCRTECRHKGFERR